MQQLYGSKYFEFNVMLFVPSGPSWMKTQCGAILSDGKGLVNFEAGGGGGKRYQYTGRRHRQNSEPFSYTGLRVFLGCALF